MNYAVIMAGGTGKRLWPLSRKSHPKQVLKLIDGQTLLRKCYHRLTPTFDNEHIIVQCNGEFTELVQKELPELAAENIIAEPAVRDTAAAIGLAASVISKRDPSATMLVVTADQVIEPIHDFSSVASDAIEYVNKNTDSLLTFGIKPTSPSSQFGYVEYGECVKTFDSGNAVCKVNSFKEKPDAETAKRYIATGNYNWNSGMFAWKAKTILERLFVNLPDMKAPLVKIADAWDTPQRNSVLESEFLNIPKISIDYAVMEKDDKVYSIKLDADWLDLGSFEALREILDSDENSNIVAAAKSELLDCKDSIFVTEDDGHIIAAIGVENLIVAHSKDATLICPAGESGRLKELLEKIEKNGGLQHL